MSVRLSILIGISGVSMRVSPDQDLAANYGKNVIVDHCAANYITERESSISAASTILPFVANFFFARLPLQFPEPRKHLPRRDGYDMGVRDRPCRHRALSCSSEHHTLFPEGL